MFKPHYLPSLKRKEVLQVTDQNPFSCVFSLLFHPSSCGSRSALASADLALDSPWGAFWPCCPCWLSRNHLSFRIPQLTVNGARKEPDPIIPSLSQTWLLAEGVSVWFSFWHFFLFFPDKPTDLGARLATAQFKLYVITCKNQKWKASKSVVSGAGT